MKWWLVLLVLATAAMQSPAEVAVAERGLRLYRQGRYELALQALAGAIDSAGEQVAAEVRLNASLAALRLLRSRDAEQFVAPLVDDASWRDEAAFVLGLASSQHAERAVLAAKLADAEPMAWAMASRAIRSAELQFRAACRLRPDWAEAVRNLERVQRRRDEIEQERAAAKAPDAKKEDAPKPEPDKPKPDEPQQDEVVVPEVAQSRLTAGELQKLQERVRAQQRQKVRTRQHAPRRGVPAGGRDW